MRKHLFYTFLCIAFSINVNAQVDLDIEDFAEGLSLPLDIVHNGSDLLFVVEKNGTIAIIEPDGRVMGPRFIDISDRVDASESEKGLLGLAFHPDFENNGEFYVNYTDARGLTVISRFTTMPGQPLVGDPDSEEKILQYVQPFANHNGGDMAFGPDGYLYIASGDGGSANDPFDNSQTGTNLLGKLLRIDVNDTATYQIPADNPFVGDLSVNDEIWALGLRNPWRFSFDRQTGDLWIGDVGQGSWEEINFQPASSPGGENYGWRCYEGNHAFNTSGCQSAENYDFPIFEYPNNRFNFGCSITGGYVYRGSEYPTLQGLYIYADFCSGRIWALNPADTTNVEVGNFADNQFVGFGENAQGDLFLAAIGQGKIYKIIAPCNLQITTMSTDETCPGSNDGTASITLSDTISNYNILWSNGDTTLTVDSLEPGTYTVNIIGGTCDIEETIFIEPSDLQTSCLIDTIFDQVYCEGDTILLRSCEAPQGYIYEWSQFDAVIAQTIDPVLYVTESGTYSVAFMGDCPLGASDEVEITFTMLPDQADIMRTMDTLWVDLIADTYRWYLNDTFLIETVDPYILIQENGDYTVEGVNAGLCTGPLSEVFSVISTQTGTTGIAGLQIFPNPTGRWLNIELTEFQNTDISIYSGAGQLLRIEQLTSVRGQIDLADIPDGVLFIKIEGPQGSQTNRILKLVK